jgi:catalase-peroxidase
MGLETAFRSSQSRGVARSVRQDLTSPEKNDRLRSNSQLRSIVDVYAGSDGHHRFVTDFIKVWHKVMMLDRYDVTGHRRYAPMAA